MKVLMPIFCCCCCFLERNFRPVLYQGKCDQIFWTLLQIMTHSIGFWRTWPNNDPQFPSQTHVALSNISLHFKAPCSVWNPFIHSNWPTGRHFTYQLRSKLMFAQHCHWSHSFHLGICAVSYKGTLHRSNLSRCIVVTYTHTKNLCGYASLK